MSELKWFAVHVKSRHEKVVDAHLAAKEFETFLPVYTKERSAGGRVKTSELPLFPGYVFCRLDPSKRLPVLMAPGVIGIVGAGKTPVPVDAQELDALRQTVASGLRVQPVPFTEIGAQVVISDGPLRGIRGILVRHKSSQRLVLSVALLRQAAAVEIDARWVRSMERGADVPRKPADLAAAACSRVVVNTNSPDLSLRAGRIARTR